MTDKARIQAAWELFAEAVRDVPNHVLWREAAPNSSLEIAEGARYLSRQVRIALEDFMEFSDPEFPQLFRYTSPTRKVGIDNPDTDYYRACISGSLQYRLTGWRNSAHYISLGLFSGFYGMNKDEVGTKAHYNLDQFAPLPGGRVDLWIGGPQRGPNWIPIPHGTDRLEVHQTFMNREGELPANLHVECIDRRESQPRLTVDDIVMALDRARTNLLGGASLWEEFSEAWMERPNTFRSVGNSEASGLQGNRDTIYLGGYWDLGTARSLVIRFIPPLCHYWGFQLATHWLESLDYRFGRASINAGDAVMAEDRSVEIVISAKNVGHANWIDNRGHTRGVMLLRCLGVKEAFDINIDVTLR